MAGALAWSLWAGMLLAAPLDLPPTAQLLAERISPLDSYQLPVEGFADGTVPSQRLEGRVNRWTWRLGGSAVTTLQILAPLAEQLDAEGYTTVFRCRDRDCGGFDFRFEIEVVPAPDMHVDIRDFRFLSATRPGGEAISLLVSRSRQAAYVQMIHVVPAAPQTPRQPADPFDAPDDLVANLLDRGHVILPDLDFATGAVDLNDGAYPSLEALAAFLAEREDLMLVIVGHTDSVGSLAQNIELSRRRADAVRGRLIESYRVDPVQLRAEGMGYLAPVASNLTPQGREANRRVEAVVLPKP